MSMMEDLQQAAALMKANRYEQVPDEQRAAMWQELNQIAAELCYHLDDEKVLPKEGLVQLRAAGHINMGLTGTRPASSELVITTLIQKHIDQLQGEHHD